MYMEQTECSETSAYKIQTPGNYPEQGIQNEQPYSPKNFPACESFNIFFFFTDMHLLKLLSRIYKNCSLTFCWPCISVINQLDAQNFCFAVSFISCLYMFRAHVFIIRRSKLPEAVLCNFDLLMCSKHVEAWNKLIEKQKCCASSWLITEINIKNYVRNILIENLNHISNELARVKCSNEGNQPTWLLRIF